MKARVQYNDYRGTAAADVSDIFKLEEYLEKKGVDTKRYECVGVEFYSGYTDYFSVRFLCIDREGDKNVTLGFEKGVSKEEFFNLFKRFNVVVTWAKGVDYSDLEFDDNTIMIDDRK